MTRPLISSPVTLNSNWAAKLSKSDAAAKRALARPFNNTTLAKELLKPTRIYVRAVLDLVEHFPIRAMAHITGGGIEGNLVRVLPRGVRACIQLGTWPVPEIFQAIAERGPVDLDEMLKTFNMGIGYIIVVPTAEADRVAARCRELKQPCRPIGWIDAGKKPEAEPEVLLLR